MPKNIAKNSLPPSVKNPQQGRFKPAKSMMQVNFSDTVPRDVYWYQEMQTDNPDYWNTESAYLGAVTATDAATAAPEKPWYEKLVDIYGSYTAQRTASKMQSQLAAENLARAKTGQPPISIETYAAQSAPQFNVGLSQSTKNLLIYGGIGLAAILLIPPLLKRR